MHLLSMGEGRCEWAVAAIVSGADAGARFGGYDFGVGHVQHVGVPKCNRPAFRRRYGKLRSSRITTNIRARQCFGNCRFIQCFGER
jgi:hypothetical protein